MSIALEYVTSLKFYRLKLSMVSYFHKNVCLASVQNFIKVKTSDSINLGADIRNNRIITDIM